MLAKYKWFFIFYCILDFILFYLYRLVILGFFVSFCFLHLDFRYITYLIPVSFFIWLLSFIFYYYNYFFKSNLAYIQDMLKVTPNTPLASSENESIIIQRKISELTFELTPLALTEGLTVSDLPLLKSLWLRMVPLEAHFLIYQRFCSMFSRISLVLNFFCWFYISYIYFYTSGISFSIFVLFRRCFKPSFPTRMPRDARMFKSEKAQTHG